MGWQRGTQGAGRPDLQRGQARGYHGVEASTRSQERGPWSHGSQGVRRPHADSDGGGSCGADGRPE